jgi:hypothetical protein
VIRAACTVAAAIVTAGACGSVLVSGSGEAWANTPTHTITCAGTPLGTLSSSAITTGQFPTSVKVKAAFTLTNSNLRLTITNSELLHFGAGLTVGGKVVTALATKGALPANQAITYTLNSTRIPSPAPASLTVTAKGSATTFKTSKAGKVSVWTTGSAEMSLFLQGTTFGPYGCISSPSFLQIAKTVAAS